MSEFRKTTKILRGFDWKKYFMLHEFDVWKMSWNPLLTLIWEIYSANKTVPSSPKTRYLRPELSSIPEKLDEKLTSPHPNRPSSPSPTIPLLLCFNKTPIWRHKQVYIMANFVLKDSTFKKIGSDARYKHSKLQ